MRKIYKNIKFGLARMSDIGSSTDEPGLYRYLLLVIVLKVFLLQFF